MFAQLNGIDVISFYLPSSLSSAGSPTQRALLFTATNAVIYTASTVPTWWLADRWGRRPLLITGGICMAVALSIMCVFKQAQGLTALVRANGIFSFVVLYNALYGATWGPIPWLLPAEIFPLRARSKGMALSTFSNWTFNFIIGMSSPAAFARLGGYYYIIISGLCLVSVLLVKFVYPETAGCTFEGVASKFEISQFWRRIKMVWVPLSCLEGLMWALKLELCWSCTIWRLRSHRLKRHHKCMLPCFLFNRPTLARQHLSVPHAHLK